MPPARNPRPPKSKQLSLLPLFEETACLPSPIAVPPRAPVPTWLESVAVILAVMAFGFLWIGLEESWGSLDGKPVPLGKGAGVELSLDGAPDPISGRLPPKLEPADPHGLETLADRTGLLADRWIQRAPRGNAAS